MSVSIVDDGPDRVSRAIEIDVAAAKVFALVADPRRHSEFDGSGTVGANIDAPASISAGSRFSTKMKMFGLPYRITSTVTEYQPDALVEWRHPLGHHWRFAIESLGPTRSRVTETFDHSDVNPVISALHWYTVSGFRRRNATGIERTLVRLQEHFA